MIIIMCDLSVKLVFSLFQAVSSNEPCERLYVSGLDNTVTEEDLKEYFSTFGDIEDIIIRDRSDGCFAYAFITYADLESAIKAACVKHEVSYAERSLGVLLIKEFVIRSCHPLEGGGYSVRTKIGSTGLPDYQEILNRILSSS